MKKNITLFITFIIIFMMVVPSTTYADYDEGLEQAILKAKELFNITEEYDEFSASVSCYNGETDYILRWSDSDNRLGIIHVKMDGDGNPKSYYIYETFYEDYKLRLAKISKSDAKDIAEKFINKVNSSYTDKIQYFDDNSIISFNSRNYNVIFIRKEKGILFPYNTITLSVDNMTGQIKSYNSNWDNSLAFPDIEGIIDLEEAEEIYKEQIGLQLIYKFAYENNETIPYLVYSRLTTNDYMDALIGEVIQINQYYYDISGQESPKPIIRLVANLSLAEKEAIENMVEILSEEEVESIAREALKIDDAYQIDSINLYTQLINNGDFTWNIRFLSEDEAVNEVPIDVSVDAETGDITVIPPIFPVDIGLWIDVSVDAKTGDIISFSKYIHDDDNQEVVYDKEGAYNIAESFIDAMQPDKFSEVEYVTWNEPLIGPFSQEAIPRQYKFTFVRKINKSYVQNDGFTITVDTVTGDITRYNFSWYKGELPTSENVMSLIKAYDVLFNEIGIGLTYILDSSNKEVKLIYSIKNDKPLNIDANNGSILNYNGEIYTEQAVVQYTDINDSYAKSKIEVLAQYGISLPGDKFEPKKQITQREFLYLLVKANNYYINIPFSNESEFDDVLYTTLINREIVKEDEKSPESAPSREEAVKYIIRALDYDEVADIKGIFTVNYIDANDISPELVGYISIASGLDIIRGYNGIFDPKAELTREQAATVLYNYLKYVIIIIDHNKYDNELYFTRNN